RIVPCGTTPQTFLRTRRLPSVLSSPTVSGKARRSAGWHGQRPDPLEHRPEQPPRQMARRQQEPVVPSMFHQPPTRLDEALLEIGHDDADAREQLANVVLDFGHDPSRRGPAVRLIVEALVPDERRATGPTRRPKQEVLDRKLQVIVGRDADGVLDAACLQRLM